MRNSRNLLIALVAAASLVLAPDAVAATQGVNIYGAVFQPATVTIRVGDTVRWVNKDNANHQIVADNGTFASRVLKQGQSYSHTFKNPGTFGYKDVLGKLKRGTVVVRGAAPAASLTFGAASPILVYGTTTALTGVVSNGQAGETVTIWAQPYGAPAPTAIATTMSGVGGGFGYTAQPDRLTNYTATWGKAASSPVTLQVRPKVTFVPFERKRMYARVQAATSHAGAYVYLERLTSVGWVTIEKLKLGPLSGRIFALPRRCGTSTYRVYMSADQAGPGYLDGWSGTQRTRYRTHCRR